MLIPDSLQFFQCIHSQFFRTQCQSHKHIDTCFVEEEEPDTLTYVVEADL